jgi:hypothetical protein
LRKEEGPREATSGLESVRSILRPPHFKRRGQLKVRFKLKARERVSYKGVQFHSSNMSERGRGSNPNHDRIGRGRDYTGRGHQGGQGGGYNGLDRRANFGDSQRYGSSRRPSPGGHRRRSPSPGPRYGSSSSRPNSSQRTGHLSRREASGSPVTAASRAVSKVSMASEPAEVELIKGEDGHMYGVDTNTGQLARFTPGKEPRTADVYGSRTWSRDSREAQWEADDRDGRREGRGRKDRGRKEGGRRDRGGEDGACRDGGRGDGGREEGGRKDGGREDGGRKGVGCEDGGREDGGREDGARRDGAHGDGARGDGGREDGGREDGGRRDARGRDTGRDRHRSVARRARSKAAEEIYASIAAKKRKVEHTLQIHDPAEPRSDREGRKMVRASFWDEAIRRSTAMATRAAIQSFQASGITKDFRVLERKFSNIDSDEKGRWGLGRMVLDSAESQVEWVALLGSTSGENKIGAEIPLKGARSPKKPYQWTVAIPTDVFCGLGTDDKERAATLLQVLEADTSGALLTTECDVGRVFPVREGDKHWRTTMLLASHSWSAAAEEREGVIQGTLGTLTLNKKGNRGGSSREDPTNREEAANESDGSDVMEVVKDEGERKEQELLYGPDWFERDVEATKASLKKMMDICEEGGTERKINGAMAAAEAKKNLVMLRALEEWTDDDQRKAARELNRQFEISRATARKVINDRKRPSKGTQRVKKKEPSAVPPNNEAVSEASGLNTGGDTPKRQSSIAAHELNKEHKKPMEDEEEHN